MAVRKTKNFRGTEVQKKLILGDNISPKAATSEFQGIVVGQRNTHSGVGGSSLAGNGGRLLGG
jgi:hypothetical protein